MRLFFASNRYDEQLFLFLLIRFDLRRAVGPLCADACTQHRFKYCHVVTFRDAFRNRIRALETVAGDNKTYFRAAAQSASPGNQFINRLGYVVIICGRARERVSRLYYRRRPGDGGFYVFIRLETRIRFPRPPRRSKSVADLVDRHIIIVIVIRVITRTTILCAVRDFNVRVVFFPPR